MHPSSRIHGAVLEMIYDNDRILSKHVNQYLGSKVEENVKQFNSETNSVMEQFVCMSPLRDRNRVMTVVRHVPFLKWSFLAPWGMRRSFTSWRSGNLEQNTLFGIRER